MLNALCLTLFSLITGLLRYIYYALPIPNHDRPLVCESPTYLNA